MRYIRDTPITKQLRKAKNKGINKDIPEKWKQ